jgi:hypothetical protein
MPRLQLNVVGTVGRRSDAYPLVKRPGDAVIVHRDHDRLFVLRCPCGCGEDIVTNLDRQAGPAWRIYRTSRGTSLFPSVWLETGCASHYIIWDDRILLFGEPWLSWYDDDEVSKNDDINDRVVSALKALERPSDFQELAQLVDEIPWAVSYACRRLVMLGRLVEVSDGVYGLGRRRR